MKDKKKLTAAIMGAIAVENQMEQQATAVTPRVKLQTKTSRWRISRQQELMKAKRVKAINFTSGDKVARDDVLAVIG